MSEHPILKHSLKTYKIWKNSNMKWRHKILEITIEVLIIVFAVWITLNFERMREHQHDRKIEKEFLNAYRADLLSDTAELKSDFAGYGYIKQSLIQLTNGNADSIRKYVRALNNLIQFIPNSSRFEALKNSGQLHVIRNHDLLSEIIDLYQHKIAGLQIFGTDPYISYYSNHFLPFLENYSTKDEYGNYTNIEKVLQMNFAKNYLKSRIGLIDAITAHYDLVIRQCEKILIMINAELGNNK